MIGGWLWAGVAAWLYLKRGVEVVISTILLNFVALQLLGWAVDAPLRERGGQLPQTDLLPDSMMLWRPDRQMDFHAGVFVALVAAALVQVWLFRTVGGFRARLVGANARVARANWINTRSVQFKAMALSGALCGLAGGVEYAGMAGQLSTDFSQGWGFLAIPVALLGGLHPVGSIGSALFFGAVFAGSEHLSRFTVSGSTLLYVVQGAAVLGFIGFKAVADRRSVAAGAT
jgi:simple sugar transport system permease protein